MYRRYLIVVLKWDKINLKLGRSLQIGVFKDLLVLELLPDAILYIITALTRKVKLDAWI